MVLITTKLVLKHLKKSVMKTQHKHLMMRLKQNPNDAIGYVNFGNLLATMNDVERAERFFQKAITVDEKAATAYYGLSEFIL